jgi:hypothetical protein
LCGIEQQSSTEKRNLVFMNKGCASVRQTTRLFASVFLASIVLAASPASAQPVLGSAQNFAILAGAAVTCTNAKVIGDVGVWPGTAVTRTGCTIDGRVHRADRIAEQAFLDFTTTYNNLRDNPPACRETLIGTLAGEVLVPGVYCVDPTAKTGNLTLDGQGDPNATWTFLVNSALTGTNFNVSMINGGEPCNVTWWVADAATLTTSNFIGTILAGAAITVTGGTFHGDALAKAAVTVTGAAMTACAGTAAGPGDGHPRDHGKCNQGVGNGPEGCDPGNSNQGRPGRSNDELGGTPGNPGRKGGNNK